MAITGWKEGKKDVKYYVSNPFQTVELDASAGPTLTTEPMSQPGPGRAVGWAASWLPVLHWRGLDKGNLGLIWPGSCGNSLIYHTGIHGRRGRMGQDHPSMFDMMSCGTEGTSKCPSGQWIHRKSNRSPAATEMGSIQVGLITQQGYDAALIQADVYLFLEDLLKIWTFKIFIFVRL